MEILKPKLGGGGGLLREEFELHLTDRMRIAAVYWIAPSSDADRKHINLRIEQYKKKPTDLAFPSEPFQKINLQDDDVAKLIASARAQSILQDADVTDRVVVLRGDEAGRVANLTTRDVGSITRLVDSLSDANIEVLARTVNAEVVSKIDAAVRHLAMEKSLAQLNATVAGDADESVFQRWFEQNEDHGADGHD